MVYSACCSLNGDIQKELFSQKKAIEDAAVKYVNLLVEEYNSQIREAIKEKIKEIKAAST